MLTFSWQNLCCKQQQQQQQQDSPWLSTNFKFDVIDPIRVPSLAQFHKQSMRVLVWFHTMKQELCRVLDCFRSGELARDCGALQILLMAMTGARAVAIVALVLALVAIEAPTVCATRATNSVALQWNLLFNVIHCRTPGGITESNIVLVQLHLA